MVGRLISFSTDAATWRDWLIGGVMGIATFLVTLVLACYI